MLELGPLGWTPSLAWVTVGRAPLCLRLSVEFRVRHAQGLELWRPLLPSWLSPVLAH